MKDIINSTQTINSYIDKNRIKIDEALVSLRLMKEVDDFLDINDVSQRDFASNLGYSEAFISQLMSGTKKFNTSFINKLEKVYDLKINFQIEIKDNTKFITKFSNSFLEININVISLSEVQNTFALENNPNEFLKSEINFLEK